MKFAEVVKLAKDAPAHIKTYVHDFQRGYADAQFFSTSTRQKVKQIAGRGTATAYLSGFVAAPDLPAASWAVSRRGK